MNPIELAVFEKSGGPLTKRIALRDGKIVNDSSACRMVNGNAHRVRINNMRELADLINGFTPREAYALGRLRDDLPDQVRVVRKRDLNGGVGVISRGASTISASARASPAWRYLTSTPRRCRITCAPTWPTAAFSGWRC